MKSPLLLVILALELVTLGLVVGLVLRRNDSTQDPQVAELLARVTGAANQEREVIRYLEQLRRDLSAKRNTDVEETPAAESGIASGSAESSKHPSPSPAVPPAFADAQAALVKLKETWQQLQRDTKNEQSILGPLKESLEQQRKALLGRGGEAVYVVGHEVSLQVFEPGRDVGFIEYLLNDLVPALSGGAPDDVFQIARGALVRKTNEAPIRYAAALALRAIDRQRWVKEVLDVASLGTSDVVLCGKLLGLFADDPRPESVDLLKRYLEDARQPPELRSRALEVLKKQERGDVLPCLRRILFDDPAPTLKNYALDALCDRLTDATERRALLDEVMRAGPAKMSPAVLEKARKLLDAMPN